MRARRNVANVLVLCPTPASVRYAVFRGGHRRAVMCGREEVVAPGAALARVAERTRGVRPSVIGVEAAFGGEAFSRPVVVSNEVKQRLLGLIGAAPMHVCLVLELVRHLEELYPDVPVVLAFQTAFFVDLPERERYYALESEETLKCVRRYGHQGLYHQAAFRYAYGLHRERGCEPPGRCISICLEPRPEVAGILAGRPLTVTGGCTPLEGLPGHTSCGEVDPAIVLLLAQRLRWGPEVIDRVLTQESGLLALVGRPVTLEDVFASRSRECRFARAVMRYRILQACGAAMAALGGVDVIVFSGRYAHLGRHLGPYLCKALDFPGSPGKQASWLCYDEELER